MRDDIMFEKELLTILGDKRKSTGWLTVATEMNYSVSQLQQLVTDQQLSFDQSLDLVRASKSPELLRYIMHRLDLGSMDMPATLIH